MIGQDVEYLEAENGGHRIQRVPPTETRGRVHTSTVVVAVVPEITVDTTLDERDLSVSWFSGTGKGGQKRNKVQSSCRVTHTLSGITETRQGRSRTANYEDAVAAIQIRLSSEGQSSANSAASVQRRGLMGSGQRGDKSRTIRFQDNIAVDHRTNKRMTAVDYLKGKMDQLW